MHYWRFFPLAGLVLCAGPLYAQLDRSGPPTSANALVHDTAKVETGAARFRQLCTGCHGRSGEGGQGEGQGPNLATSWEVRRAKDTDLFGFIKNGVKGTAMPAFPLPEEQIWELAAFVRSLNAPAGLLSVSGDISAGETIFFGKGQCSTCHMIRGRGGYLGPDLSDLAATRRLGEIRNAILDPSSASSAGFRPILLQRSDGPPLRAVAKQTTYWSADILDENGDLHLIHGNAVQHLDFQRQSWMSAVYARHLSPEEITDLLAYLTRQSIRTVSAH